MSTTQSSAILDLKINPKDKRYNCPVCEKSLSAPSAVTRHLQTTCGKVRNASGEWKCQYCPRSYDFRGNLTRHNKYECGVPRQFYCIYCKRYFTQRCSLIRHLRNFHNEDPDSAVESRPPSNDVVEIPPGANGRLSRASSVDSGVYSLTESID